MFNPKKIKLMRRRRRRRRRHGRHNYVTRGGIRL
jgi:hypothetical protein